MRAAAIAAAFWAFAACLSAQAVAQSGAALNADEMRLALLGREMSGVMGADDGPRWRECIAPDATTVYVFEGAPPDDGRLTVTDDGQACFSYASSDYTGQACWFAFRQSSGALRFVNARGAGSDFIVKQSRRVTSCAHLRGPGV